MNNQGQESFEDFLTPLEKDFFSIITGHPRGRKQLIRMIAQGEFESLDKWKGLIKNEPMVEDIIDNVLFKWHSFSMREAFKNNDTR